MEKLGNKLINVVQTGLQAQALAVETEIGSRLPAGSLDTLEADLESLSALVRGADNAGTSARVLTDRQFVTCERGYNLLTGVRSTVSRRTRSRDIRRAYGVGEKISKRSVRGVARALELILARLAAKPEEAQRFGILESDVTAMQVALDEIVAADRVQEEAKSTRPFSTRSRDAAARRVSETVGLIAAAGLLAFAHDPERRRRFAALVSRAGRPPRKAEPEKVKEVAPG